MASESPSGASGDSIDETNDRVLRETAAIAPFGVFDVDLLAGTTYWSPELCDILGQPHFTGKVGAYVPDHVHPEDRERVHGAIRRSHAPAGDGRFETEHRIVRTDGELRWVLAKGRTLFGDVDGERRPVRAIGIVVDITERKAAEDARFKTLLAASGQILWTADPNGRLVEGAASWREFTGGEVDSSRPLGWSEAIHPDDRAHALENWEEALQRAEPLDDELRLRHADGTWRWVRARTMPLLHDDGTVRSWVGVISDVTERKQAELDARRLHAREREANALLDAIFASAPIGLAVWDRELRFQRVNAGLAEMNGLPVEAHIGKRVDELLPDLEAVEDLSWIWRQVLETGEPWLGIEVRGETPARPGQQRSWKEDFFPVRVHGDIVGVAAVVQETTERRVAEAQLRESEARFRQMADNAPFMVWVTSPDRACTFLSRSWYEFTGQNAATALGAGWSSMLHPDDRVEFEETFRDAQRRQSQFRVELRMRRHDGQYRWVINAAAPRFSPGRKFKGYIGSIIDITERKLAEQALENADRQKDEFLAMLAHELRNPLAPMQTALELLGRLSPEGDDRLADLRRTAERQLHHLTRLVDDLLDTSRITTGRIVLKSERTDLRDVLRHSLETSGPLIASRGHRIVTRQPEDPLWVEGDPVRLAQIVTNLLNNAAKFTAPGGRIDVVVEREEGVAAIHVRDNGVGIASGALPHVFDPSKRGDDRHGTEGLGLGLSLVKRLAEMHGGSVDAHSDGEGCGSEFLVRLPLAPRVYDAMVEPTAGDAASPRRIMVVDDNDDAANMLAMLLEHAGHDVRKARDGQEALDVARAFTPDAVLLDIGLPDMDGWQLARELRRLHCGQALKVIAISGYGQAEDRRRSAAAGIDRHLTKPVDYAAISRCL